MMWALRWRRRGGVGSGGLLPISGDTVVTEVPPLGGIDAVPAFGHIGAVVALEHITGVESGGLLRFVDPTPELGADAVLFVEHGGELSAVSPHSEIVAVPLFSQITKVES